MAAAVKESSAQNRAASLPLRGPSPKHPYIATEGGWDSLCVAPVAPSLMGAEIPVQERGGKDAGETGTASKIDSKAHRPSLEIPEEEDSDLLQHLPANTVARSPTSSPFHMRALGPRDVGVVGDRGVEDAVIVNTTGGASLAFGLAASATLPPTMVASASLHSGGWIALPLVERTTRYAILLDFLYVVSIDGA